MKRIEIPLVWVVLAVLIVIFLISRLHVKPVVQAEATEIKKTKLDTVGGIQFEENMVNNKLALEDRTEMEINDEVQSEEIILNSNEQFKELEVTTIEEVEEIIEIEENMEEEITELTPTISIEEVEIAKDMDLTVRTGLSKQDFVELLSNLGVDTSGFFKENAETIYDLCAEYNINEIFFCGLIAEESGWNIAENHRRTHNYISLMSGGKLISYIMVLLYLELRYVFVQPLIHG